ncbi:MAG: thermonuclease family protein [Alphaproteobacteria bacterium]|nr:thermonuclease family protein [Alphaproteobacteria bacterium]
MRRRTSFLVWLLIIAVAAALAELWRSGPALLGRPPAATGEAFSGRARVVDGDSLEVSGRRVRLFGIDAPEARQDCRDGRGRVYACGEEARRALSVAIGGRPVTCTPVGASHDRSVAVCTAGERDLSEAMVRNGHALELRRFSNGRYAEAEREARAAKRGLWQGDFTLPSEWRRAQER